MRYLWVGAMGIGDDLGHS